MERRKFTRVDFETKATLTSGDGSRSTGRVSNLSLNGVFVEVGGAYSEGDALDLTIHLTSVSTDLCFDMKGTVVRALPDGVGVEFVMEGIELDSLVYLRNIVSYNATGDEEIMDEYYAFLERRDHPKSTK